MPAIRWRKRVLASGAVALAALAWYLAGPGRPIHALQAKRDLTQAKFYGVSACLKCHADGERGKWQTDMVLMTEYETWRTKDKHALAYAALEGPRGQRM